MTPDRKPTRRIMLGVALMLSVTLGVSACGTSEETTYANGQQKEFQDEATAKAEGTIEPGFDTLVTIEDKAQAKIENISSILAAGTNGVLVTNSARTNLIRVYEGKVAWQSADVSFESARFVQDGDRAWIVAVQKADGATNVLVYDAFASGKDQQPVRKQSYGAEANVVLSNNGVAVVDGEASFKYSPRTGLSQQISLPAGIGLVTIVPSGYIITKDNKISLVGEDGQEKWNSDAARPSGMPDTATASVLAFATSTVAVQWTNDQTTELTFLDANSGEVIGSTTEKVDEEERYVLRNAQGSPYVYVSNVLVNVSTGKVSTVDARVTDIVDGIVYLDNGEGLDLETLDPVWTRAEAGVVPNLIYQRTAFYITDETLYTFNLKAAQQAPTPTESSTPEESENSE